MRCKSTKREREGERVREREGGQTGNISGASDPELEDFELDFLWCSLEKGAEVVMCVKKA
jgi:hypothetical protein